MAVTLWTSCFCKVKDIPLKVTSYSAAVILILKVYRESVQWKTPAKVSQPYIDTHSDQWLQEEKEKKEEKEDMEWPGRGLWYLTYCSKQCRARQDVLTIHRVLARNRRKQGVQSQNHNRGQIFHRKAHKARLWLLKHRAGHDNTRYVHRLMSTSTSTEKFYICARSASYNFRSTRLFPGTRHLRSKAFE